MMCSMTHQTLDSVINFWEIFIILSHSSKLLQRCRASACQISILSGFYRHLSVNHRHTSSDTNNTRVAAVSHDLPCDPSKPRPWDVVEVLTNLKHLVGRVPETRLSWKSTCLLFLCFTTPNWFLSLVVESTAGGEGWMDGWKMEARGLMVGW